MYFKIRIRINLYLYFRIFFHFIYSYSLFSNNLKFYSICILYSKYFKKPLKSNKRIQIPKPIFGYCLAVTAFTFPEFSLNTLVCYCSNILSFVAWPISAILIETFVIILWHHRQPAYDSDIANNISPERTDSENESQNSYGDVDLEAEVNGEIGDPDEKKGLTLCSYHISLLKLIGSKHIQLQMIISDEVVRNVIVKYREGFLRLVTGLNI